MSTIEEIRKIPLFRLVIPFIIGIIVQIKLDLAFPYFIPIIFSLLVFSYIISSINIATYYKSIVFGILISIAITLSGVEFVRLVPASSSYETNFENGVYIADIIEEIQLKEKTVKTKVNIKHIKIDNEIISLDEQVLIYLPIVRFHF